MIGAAGGACAMGAVWLDGHFALFAWLVLSGFGVPPGEDLLVASTGALLSTGDLTASIVVPMAIAAVVLSDTLMFSSGRAARAALAHRAAWVSRRTLSAVESLLGRWDVLAVALARFVPGLRTLVFMSAGARGMSRARFLAADACAALVWVPLMMTCGAAIVSFVLGAASESAQAWFGAAEAWL